MIPWLPPYSWNSKRQKLLPLRFDRQLPHNYNMWWLVVPISYLGLQCSFRSNSSDRRVVRASASGAVGSGLIPIRVKPMTLKLVFTASLLDVQQQTGKFTCCVVGKGT